MKQPTRHVRSMTTASSGVTLSSPIEARAEAEALAHREWLLDDSLMQTFPASDAISPGFMT
ncbi:MAG: hypothetical protein WCA85_26820 [Paraburkholderia sp.]|uniref:hypothetical protein n=1 Tax=Paraburkholderia sp. TaxID=1926495 RepID=UPI003C6BB186